MLNHIERDGEYIRRLSDFVKDKYSITVKSIAPAVRGYYGETWRINAAENSYFLKLDYFPRHKEKFKNSLSAVDYLCGCGIDFISKVIKTKNGGLYASFEGAVLAVFEWLEGENVETDETKMPEYEMLCRVYSLTRPGLNIPTQDFSSLMAERFFEKWHELKSVEQNKANAEVLELLERQGEILRHCSARLIYFSELCKDDLSNFYLTHGDAGGNFFVSGEHNYIVDWDEVMYAPLERDAWVMCCRDWARKLFNDTLKQNNINYKLSLERLAFYCYHMFFLYLCEFLEDFTVHGIRKDIEDYFSGFIIERVKYADTI